jgi:hypothetical protein
MPPRMTTAMLLESILSVLALPPILFGMSIADMPDKLRRGAKNESIPPR